MYTGGGELADAGGASQQRGELLQRTLCTRGKVTKAFLAE